MATYFEYFPYITYTLKASDITAPEVVQDIFRRVGFLSNLKGDARVFYPYTIAESDTPEIIAHKLYGDINLYWIVTLFNDILDPLLDWPKTYSQFQRHIADMYGSIALAKSTTHHYIKTIEKINSQGFTTSAVYIIDLTTYNTLTSAVSEAHSFADGSTLNITTTRSIVSVYDHESELNEAKRSINLLKVEYVPLAKSQLQALSA